MRRVNSLILAAGIAGAVLAGFGSTAHAQYQQPPAGYGAPPPGYYPPPPPPRAWYRTGLTFGVGIGPGSITTTSTCGDFCGAAIALEGHIGGMLNPRLAIMGDFWLNAHPIPNSDGTTTNSISSLALQYWLTDIIWIKGGLGIGHTQVLSDSEGVLDDATGLGLLAAGGIELIHAPNFALDLALRFGHGFYDGGDVDNFALTLALNWY